MRSYNEAACEFADLVYEKWKNEVYSLKSCVTEYEVSDIEQRKLELNIIKFGFDCKTSKAIYAIK